jgi:hypothetical protein
MASEPIIHTTYTIGEHDERGIIEITCSGFFDDEATRDNFLRLKEVIARWRRLGRDIRVLFDATKMVAQSAEMIGIARQEINAIYRDEDKVAIMASSALVKMQMDRLDPGSASKQFFVSKRDAILWLQSGPQI